MKFPLSNGVMKTQHRPADDAGLAHGQQVKQGRDITVNEPSSKKS